MKAQRAIDKRVPRARRLRRHMTEAERRLWWHLRRLPAGDSHFRRQATVGPYFADFACHAKRLIVEIDGGQHGFGRQEAQDRLRDRYFTENSYRVLQFWNNDVLKNVEGVLSVIAEAIAASRIPPTPNPSPPQAGGGEKKHRV